MTHFTTHILDENERILLKVRKHWFLIFRDIIGIFFMVFIPILLMGITPIGAALLGSPQGVFLTSLWLMAGSIAVATIWTNYYLDVWIVTDKRIVNVEQLTLFSRETTTLRVERIQDATVEIHGFLAEMIGYGNLRIQSAGDSGEHMIFHGLPNPEYVRGVVLEQVDSVTEHKNKLSFTHNERPISSE
ncbi:MAG: hypothetical protein RI911_287 [Candidatus Parcubacteria bacterium]